MSEFGIVIEDCIGIVATDGSQSGAQCERLKRSVESHIAAAVAEEREANAEIADDQIRFAERGDYQLHAMNDLCEQISAAIRARANKEGT